MQDVVTEGNIKEEELDHQDIQEEIPDTGVLATTSLIPKVR